MTTFAGKAVLTGTVAGRVHRLIEEAGRRVVKVSPALTGQVCSGCGSLVRKSLAVRIHACPECGLTVDRDVNAARGLRG